MQKSQQRRPDAHDAYRAAGDMLAKEGKRLLLIESLILGLVAVGAHVMLYQVFSLLGTLFKMTATELLICNTIYWLLVCALVLFMTLPLALGILRMAGRIEAGEIPTLVEVFYYFSSGVRYRRALCLSFGGFWRMLCVVLAVTATCGTAVYFFGGDLLAGILCGVAVLLEVFLWLFLVLRRFPVFAVAFDEELSIKDVRRIAKEMARYDRLGGMRFFFAYLPRILLGLLTFGVYLLWDVLPCIGVAYFSYCKQMNDMIIRSEE